MYEDWLEYDDMNLYDEDTREMMLEDDVISAWEEAFLRGYDEAEA